MKRKTPSPFSQSGRVALRACLLPAILLLLAAPFYPKDTYASDGDRTWSLNVYTGRMTSNHWEDFFTSINRLSFKDSYMTAVTLARRVGRYKDMASFEVEGQAVKHFDYQRHWELNALITARWEAFPWDRHLDTSLAFGLGPSYATDEPEIEIDNDKETSRFLVYWMMELAVSLPDYPRVAFIARIHHRSDAFGLVADDGGSNALVFGLKYRF